MKSIVFLSILLLIGVSSATLIGHHQLDSDIPRSPAGITVDDLTVDEKTANQTDAWILDSLVFLDKLKTKRLTLVYYLPYSNNIGYDQVSTPDLIKRFENGDFMPGSKHVRKADNIAGVKWT